jgi:filamentous hemagglutinin family protein
MYFSTNRYVIRTQSADRLRLVKPYSVLIGFLTAALGSAITFAAGSIVFDNTLPGQAHGTTTVVPLRNGHYTIDAAHTGYLTGKNLFESFATFNIAGGEEADFTNSTNVLLANVVSRVTGVGSPNGLQPTTINGNLASSIAGANFWFVNPAGVMIGSGATINVPAGLAIGKADFIQFSDNSRWYAIGSNAVTPTVLSTASPASFGFLPGSSPGIVGSGTPNYSPTGGQTSISARGPITLQSTDIDTSSTGAAIAISGRSVELDQTFLTTGGGDVNINGSTGSVSLQGSIVDSSGGGKITITGNGLLIAGRSQIIATLNDTTLGGDITLQSTGTAVEASPQTVLDHATSGVVRIVDSAILSLESYFGNGIVSIGAGGPSSAGALTNDVVIAGSIVASGGATVGGDDLIIRATRGVWIESSPIGFPTSVSSGIGDIRTSPTQSQVSSITPYGGILQNLPQGNISIAAGDLGVSVAHSIVSAENNFSSTDFSDGGASIKIAASGGPINLIDSTLSAVATGSVPGGNISLQTSALPSNAAGDNATAAAISLISTQLIASQTGGGVYITPSGTIAVSSAGNFGMAAGSSIVTNAGSGSSSPGIVEITAEGALSVRNSVISAVNGGIGLSSSAGGILLISANSVSLDRSTIDASTTADSPGSNIDIVAPLVAINGGTISSSTISGGNAGNISVSANGPDPQGGSALQIVGTQLSSSASAGAGNAGDINITASQGSMVLGSVPSGSLSTSIVTFADANAGQAGKITVSANRDLSIENVAFDTSVATTAATGLAPGKISLSSSNGAIGLVGSSLQASTSGTVAAGDISVSAPTVSMIGGRITASTTGTANAGDISMTATGADPKGAAALDIAGGSQIFSSASAGAGASANAGRVNLAASAGLVQIGLPSDALPTAVSTSAGSGAGAAGAITVTGSSIALGDANVSTTTAQGPALGVKPGSIVLTANDGIGPLSVTNSTLSASTSGFQQAGEMDLYGGPITISNSSISSDTTSGGAAGNIIISGLNVRIIGGEAGHDISVSTSGSGAAGDITVTASGVDPQRGAALQIASMTVGSTAAGALLVGNAGTVSISAANGSIGLGSNAVGALATQIQSSASAFTGQAGTVKISAGQNLILQDTSVDTSVAAIINNAAYTTGQIVLTAHGTISLAQSTLTASTTGAVAAGGITVTAPVVLMNGGAITASTTGTASAGDIAMTASAADPQGSSALHLIGGASISSDASAGLGAAANAGKVTLTASNGSVQLGLLTDANPTAVSTSAGSAAGAPGAITVSGIGITLGDANLTTAVVNGGGAKPGTITLTANGGSGPLTVANSILSANTSGTTQAGEIDLSGGAITVSDSSLSSGTTAAGGAGSINILGSTINVAGSQVSVATAGTGNAGDIVITARGPEPQVGAALQIIGTSVQSTAAGTPEGLAGNAGAITLDATAGSIDLGSISVDSPATQIQTSANAFAGQAGAIKMRAARYITLDNTTVDTSVATATTNTVFTPGEIVLTAAGAITMTSSTLQATTAGTVAAGDINVLAGGALQINSGTQVASAAVLSSSTFPASSAGAAGKINLTGATVTLDYANVAATIFGGSAITSPANIVLTANGPIAVANGSTINADTFGAAPGGAIQFLTPGAVTLTDVGTRISSNTSGDGVGGNIEFGAAADPQHNVFAAPIATLNVAGAATVTVNAGGTDPGAGKGGTLSIFSTGPVTLSGTDTALSSQSSNGGLGGSIMLSASSLAMGDGAVITADTDSSPSSVAAAAGQRHKVTAASATAVPVTGGSVAVITSGGISLAGHGTTISANANGSGSGGTVELTAESLTMTNGARIATQATGAGNSGAITIALKSAPSPTGTLLPLPMLLSDSLITTTAASSTGGNIQINGDGGPVILRSSGIETSAGANGNGGNITINDAGNTVLQSSSILAQANAGNGGAITINLASGALFVEDSQSLVSAQSATGNNGAINISTPASDLNSALTIPDVNVARTPELDSNVCKRSSGSRSTFVREGHGGVAPAPDGYLNSVPDEAAPFDTAQLAPLTKNKPVLASRLDTAPVAESGCP